MKVKTLLFSFTCEEFIRGNKLRGYFARRFSEYTLIHHHLGNKKLLYKFPLIQYKVLDGKPFVLGIEEGAKVLQQIYSDVKYLKIGNKECQIKNRNITFKTEDISTIENDIIYTFLTPWLALNQKNYQRWQNLSKKERKEELERILIGNILSMSKGLGYVVTEELRAEIDVRPVPITLKGIPMLGFVGEFQVNFNIPDYLGIGKSVSRGFGTVVKVKNEG